MKRLGVVTVGFLVSLGLSSSVQAEPADHWTGFYAGLTMGYGWSDRAIKVSGGDPLTQAVIDAGVLPRTLADDQAGVVGGAQAGYNHRIGWLVLGAEADFRGTDINASETVSTAVAPFFPTTTTGEQGLDFLGTVRGRVGVAPGGGLLLYGTGGFAYGHVRLSASSTTPGCVGVCASRSRSGLETGWAVGGGMEYVLTAHWSVRTEYLHYDLGSRSLSLGDPRFPALEQKYRTTADGDAVSVGFNYRF